MTRVAASRQGYSRGGAGSAWVPACAGTTDGLLPCGMPSFFTLRANSPIPIASNIGKEILARRASLSIMTAMGIFSETLPPALALLAGAAGLAIISHNARRANWQRLNAPGAFSAWCCSIILLPFLWHMNIPVAGGAALHLAGMPIFILMFGRRLAMTGISLSVLAYTLAFDARWANIGINLILLAVVPSYVGDAVMRATERFLPHNIFIYLLGNGLFGAMLMLATIGLFSLGAFQALAATAPAGGDAVAYLLLLSWGEALLTGFLLTIFTVYRPEWVLTFDDNVYLHGK